MRILFTLLSIALLSGCLYSDNDPKHVELYKKFLAACDNKKGVEAFMPYEFGPGSNGPEMMCKDGSYIVYRSFINRLPKEEQ